VDRGCDCDWGKDYGEKMEGGEERAYIARMRTVLVGSQDCTLYKPEYLEKSCDPPTMTIGFR